MFNLADKNDKMIISIPVNKCGSLRTSNVIFVSLKNNDRFNMETIYLSIFKEVADLKLTSLAITMLGTGINYLKFIFDNFKKNNFFWRFWFVYL